MKIDQNVLDRIKLINWFANCGQALLKDLEINCIYVRDLSEAKRKYQNSAWENTTLEARNKLTSYLHNKYRNEYNDWNIFTKEARAFIEQEILPKLENYREENSLDKMFIDSVKWDILNAIMESTYSSCRNRPVFFLELLKVYESGNFPCGWEGVWPEGSLIIY